MLRTPFVSIQALVARTPLSPITWLTAFAGVVIIRDFLEQYSSYTPGSRLIVDLPTIIHYGLFYLASSLLISLILVVGARLSLRTATTTVLLFLPIIWLAPLVDLLSAGIGGHIMTYLLVPGPELTRRFLTFFGGHIAMGVTLGIQVEAALILLGVFWYVLEATRSWSRALASVLMTYASLFLLGSIPSLLALGAPADVNITAFLSQAAASSVLLAGNMNPHASTTTTAALFLGLNKLFSEVLVIVAVLAAGALFYAGARNRFIAVIKNARPERLLHALLLFTLGIALSGQHTFTWVDMLSVFVVGLSFVLAGLFAVAENDLYDKAIDRISNPERPSITQRLSDDDFRFLILLFGFGALVAAYAVAMYAVFFVAFSMLIYHIYSAPPLRLKRFFGVSSALVALASLSVVLAGFFLFHPAATVVAFSPALALALFIAYLLGANLKDLKDTSGDRAAGIPTLSTLLGDRLARWTVSVVTAGVFVYIPVIALDIRTMLLPSMVAGLLLIISVNIPPYRESRAFVVYLAYLLMLIGAVALQVP